MYANFQLKLHLLVVMFNVMVLVERHKGLE